MAPTNASLTERIRHFQESHTPRMWACVNGFGRKVAFAYTADHKRVMVPYSFTGLEGLKKGDIISFYPEPSTTLHPSPVDYFALAPQIIAWAIEKDEPVDPLHAPQDVAEQISQGETQ